MSNFLLKIDEYNKVINLANSTKKTYTKALYSFSEFLAKKLSCSIEEVDLRKIHVIRLKSGDIFTPLNSSLLDEFLHENVEKGNLALLYSALKSFFKYLYKNENFPDIVSNMKFDMKKYKKEKKPTRILSRHEILRLFHNIVSHSENLVRDVLLFSLLFSTGMRISELLNIKINDIDFESEMISLTKTKTKTARIVSLRNGFGKVIKHYISVNNLSEPDYLFTEGGDKLTPGKVRSMLTKYLESANLPFVKVHSIRHSFATHMLDAGSNVFMIQQLLGHEYISSTKIYIDPNYTRNKNIVINEQEAVYRALSTKIGALLKEEI